MYIWVYVSHVSIYTHNNIKIYKHVYTCMTEASYSNDGISSPSFTEI